jgi:hypothetical protein
MFMVYGNMLPVDPDVGNRELYEKYASVQILFRGSTREVPHTQAQIIRRGLKMTNWCGPHQVFL